MASRDMKRMRGLEQGGLLAIIGDEDTVTGFLLAGIGHVDAKRSSNFLVVDAKTTQAQIEQAFRKFTTREDVAVLLINQTIADSIRHLLQEYPHAIPAILEIPSKDAPYDGTRDSIMTRIRGLFNPHH